MSKSKALILAAAYGFGLTAIKEPQSQMVLGTLFFIGAIVLLFFGLRKE